MEWSTLFGSILKWSEFIWWRQGWARHHGSESVLILLPVFLCTTFFFSLIQHFFIKNLFSANHWGYSNERGGWSHHFYTPCSMMGRWLWSIICVLSWSGSTKASLSRKSSWGDIWWSSRGSRVRGLKRPFWAEEAAWVRVLRSGQALHLLDSRCTVGRQ